MVRPAESSPSITRPWRLQHKGVKKSDDEDDHDKKPTNFLTHPWNVTASVLPQLTGWALKTMLGVTVALYILNQQHALPRPLSAVVSKALFWPTLPITACRRIGKWITPIDDTVVIGGAPFGFLQIPEKLYKEYGVRGVINFCEEYEGPVEKYEELGIQQLHLPTTDHFEPSLDDLVSAVSFIRKHKAQGNRVYVHCRAGHGRSAAGVFAWLIDKDPIVDLRELNANFCKLRNVRKTLWKQASIQELHSRLLRTGKLMGSSDADDPPPAPILDDSSDSSEDDF